VGEARADGRPEELLKLYLAGPLFTDAERAYLDDWAAELSGAGFECFVPHQEADQVGAGLSPSHVFDLDYGKGLREAEALVAWLDGAMVDDGTACEIGAFYGLMQQDPGRAGILGLATDRRIGWRRAGGPAALNLFIQGMIERAGRICWSRAELLGQLEAWRRERGV
jgi:hypothetical protein